MRIFEFAYSAASGAAGLATRGGLLCLILAAGLAAAEPLVIAHRGASADAPENTMAAFRLAWEQGADGIEGDFRLTGDGQIICMHDKSTKRTCSVNRAVASAKLAELRSLDAGAWKGSEFRGERAPTLGEVLAELPDGKQFFVEIKSGTEIIATLKREIGKALDHRPGLARQLVFICFDSRVVSACRSTWPEIKANWLVSYKKDKHTGKISPTPEEVVAELQRSKASGIGTQDRQEVVTAEFVKAVRGAGFEIHCWTVNEPVPARRLWELGVDSITTDRPADLREWIAPQEAVTESP